MSFQIATHGGRYLRIQKDNVLDEDYNYDMSRSPDDLRSAGSWFNLHEGKLVTKEGEFVEFVENGKSRQTLRAHALNEDQCTLKTVNDGRYIVAGLDGLALEREKPGPMAEFTLVRAKTNH